MRTLARHLLSLSIGVALGLVITIPLILIFTTPSTRENVLDASADYRRAERAGAGRLPTAANGSDHRDAQDFYLGILLQTPDHNRALHALAVVRGQLAGGDLDVLRQQIRTYESAIAGGVETDEHYSVAAMRILLQATLLALEDLVRPASTLNRAARLSVKPAMASPHASPPVRSTASPQRSRRQDRAPGFAPAPAKAQAQTTISGHRVAEVGRERAISRARGASTSHVQPKKPFEVVMGEGYELYQAGWYGPALSRFKTAAALAPRSPSAHLWIARAAVKAHRLREARRALEEVIRLAPVSEAGREARALLYALD